MQLVGPDALPEKEQAILDVTRMIREDFLQQSAFSDVDASSSLKKQHKMLSAILRFNSRAADALELGVELKAIKGIAVRNEIARMKEFPENEFDSKFEALVKNIDSQFDKIVKDVGK